MKHTSYRSSLDLFNWNILFITGMWQMDYHCVQALAVVVPTVQKRPLFLIEIQPLSSLLRVLHCQVSCAAQNCSTVDHFDTLAASNLLISIFSSFHSLSEQPAFSVKLISVQTHWASVHACLLPVRSYVACVESQACFVIRRVRYTDRRLGKARLFLLRTLQCVQFCHLRVWCAGLQVEKIELLESIVM